MRRSAADADEGIATRATTGLSILVVEDSSSVAAMLRFVLEREGYAVTAAADGREAQRLIATMPPPALAVLDILLPYADGFELIDDIRTHRGWQSVPILMLTSKGTDQDIARALDAGADDYMVKPFQPDELKARVRRLLRAP